MREDTVRLVERLCIASRGDFGSPYDFAWPDRLPEDALHFSPELLSIAGTPIEKSLSPQEIRRLSFFEAVNFFSLNIHGERALLEGLAARLCRDDLYTPYLHHFLDEENKHMVYFGTYCLRYAGKIYPDRKMTLPREYAPGEEDFLFFSRVLLFEEIVDVYNRRMALDQRLDSVAREINRMHHRDEARHLAFGRQLVRELYENHSPGWDAETSAGVRRSLTEYLLATWKEYFNPDVYRDVGIPEPYACAREAFATDTARARRVEVSGSALRFLVSAGILAEEPAL
jgi:para-aminobenzoate N-oxygenase AurF